MKSITGKYVALIAVTGAFVFAIPVIYWFFMSVIFHMTEISKDAADWASFGSYVGGILSPILSVSTIVFLLLSLADERKQKAIDSYEMGKLTSSNLLISRASEIEGKIDLLWSEQYPIVENAKTNQIVAMVNQRKDAWNLGIWFICDAIELFLQMYFTLRGIDEHSYYLSYVDFKYKKLFDFLIESFYDRYNPNLKRYKVEILKLPE